MQAARRREILTLTSRLGRRTEAGPRQVLARVRRRARAAIVRYYGGKRAIILQCQHEFKRVV